MGAITHQNRGSVLPKLLEGVCQYRIGLARRQLLQTLVVTFNTRVTGFIEIRWCGHQHKSGIGSRPDNPFNIAQVFIQWHLLHLAPPFLQVESARPLLKFLYQFSGELPPGAVRVIQHIRRPTEGKPGIHQAILDKSQLVAARRKGCGIVRQFTGCTHGVAAIGQRHGKVFCYPLRPDGFVITFYPLGIAITEGNTTVHSVVSHQ